MTGSGLCGVDLDDGQVGFRVAGDQLGDVPLAVGQGDQDLADAVDHVVIGHDVSAGVDDHAGAHAVDAAAGVGAGRPSAGRGGDRLLAADIDHRRPHPLDRLDDRRLPQLRCDRRSGPHASPGQQPQPTRCALRDRADSTGKARQDARCGSP